MKIFKYIIGLSALLLLSACSSKKPLVVHKPLYDFKVEKNSDITMKKNGTKEYQVTTPDIMHLGWGHTGEFVKDHLVNKVIFKDINKEGTLIEITFYLHDSLVSLRHHRLELIATGLQTIIHELNERNVKYFQIAGPFSLSNRDGFPINNVSDLSIYLVPEISNPEEDDNELKYESMDGHSSIVFTGEDREKGVKLFINIIENPTPDQIVWDVEKNLN